MLLNILHHVATIWSLLRQAVYCLLVSIERLCDVLWHVLRTRYSGIYCDAVLPVVLAAAQKCRMSGAKSSSVAAAVTAVVTNNTISKWSVLPTGTDRVTPSVVCAENRNID